MNLKNERKLVSNVLNVGRKRIKFDPERVKDVSQAITRHDIRDMIKKGWIKVEKIKGNSRGRVRKKIKQRAKRRGTSQGSRKGSANARTPKKEAWIKRTRLLRTELKKARDEKKIERTLYRKLRNRIKGGNITTKKRLSESMEKLSG